MPTSSTDARVFPRRPSVVGHRGLGSGVVDGHTENTIASFLAAVEVGVDWVELDVTRTGDDALVTHHNPTTRSGQFLVGRSAAELASQGVPALEEVFDALPAEVPVDVDVKTVLEDATTGPERWTPALLAPVLARESRRRRLLVTSFDPAALLALRELVPGLACGLIAWLHFPLRIAAPAAVRLDMQAVCLHHGSFGPNPIESGRVHHDPEHSVEVCHEAGLEVLAWCPPADDTVRLLDAGVDAVCVNDVPRMLPLVRSWAPRS